MPVLLVACSPNHPAVTVVNDLDFTIAIFRCETKRALADPKLISPGQQKVIHPGAACIVSGPAGKEGFLNGVLNPGPYIGCLLVPRDSERTQGITLQASDARADISESVCDRTGPE